ncbi:MAG: hypothetical protein ACOX6N_01110 [Patescibacteria group bacterium]|jgi:hypothetical protein
MQRAIWLAGRTFLLAFFGVMAIMFLLWEMMIYLPKQGERGVFKMGNSEQVVLGETSENTETVKEQQETVIANDARPEIIRRYLEKYKSPLTPYSELIFQLSQDYGFEYYWIIAIAQQESNLCKKIPEGSHNCWGYGIHSKGTLKFDNYDLALRSFAEYLKRQYFDKGLNTPELIMKKYCPHSNGSWAFGVQQFIDEMESGKL